MQTKLTSSPNVAAQYILSGEVVAFPTETVYGLGANIFDREAIRKIFIAKGRPSDNPLIAHIGSLAELDLLAENVSPAALKLIDGFMPGPLTLVLPKRSDVPAIATAGLDTIGVRMPLHKLALSFIRACGVPLVAPSANLSGKPSPTTWQAVKEDLDGRIACILKGDATDFGLESTVVDCTGDTPVVLRTGAITLEQLQEVIPAIALENHDPSKPVRSPGVKYKHYAPRARVMIVPNADSVIPSTDAAFIGLNPPTFQENFHQTQICASIEEYARKLFAYFRHCDELGVKMIYCEAVPASGIGLALMDRIRKASQD